MSVFFKSILRNNSSYVIAVVIVVTSISVLLNIPILRPACSFIYLSVIPGYLILGILKLNDLALTVKIILSVGLSITFAMLFGLLLNIILPGLGYEKPLSTLPLITSFSLVNIGLLIISFLRNRDYSISLNSFALNMREKVLILIPVALPLLSILGLRLMNSSGVNTLLMILLLLIPAYVIFLSFYHNNVPAKVYPITIFCISLSMVLLLSLRTSHLIGSDIHDLYFFFRSTVENEHWSLVGPSLVESCLVSSILPAVYQKLLGINPEFLYKILFSLLFSISPLIVYIIAKKYLSRLYALLASFLFISQFYFPWTAGIANTAIAILFFALAIMVMFLEDVSLFNKRLLLILFFFSCIVSHYSTSYIFLAVVLLVEFGMFIASRFINGKRTHSTSSMNPDDETDAQDNKRAETLTGNSTEDSQLSPTNTSTPPMKSPLSPIMILLFFVLIFLWYGQIIETPFNVGIKVIAEVFSELSQGLLVELKNPTIAAATGTGIVTIPQQVRLVVSWLCVGFIAIGVLYSLLRYKIMLAIPRFIKYLKPDFLKEKLSVDFLIIALVCSSILCISVILPFIMIVYSMERTYYQLITILAPFFVIGGIIIARLIKIKPYYLILPVLILFFMATTGSLYELFGLNSTIILDSEGKGYDTVVVHDQESYAAKWIAHYGKERTYVYAGETLGTRVFQSQSAPASFYLYELINAYEQGTIHSGYIYLRNIDLNIENIVTEYPEIFINKNKIYTAGISEAWR